MGLREPVAAAAGSRHKGHRMALTSLEGLVAGAQPASQSKPDTPLIAKTSGQVTGVLSGAMGAPDRPVPLAIRVFGLVVARPLGGLFQPNTMTASGVARDGATMTHTVAAPRAFSATARGNSAQEASGLACTASHELARRGIGGFAVCRGWAGTDSMDDDSLDRGGSQSGAPGALDRGQIAPSKRQRNILRSRDDFGRQAFGLVRYLGCGVRGPVRSMAGRTVVGDGGETI